MLSTITSRLFFNLIRFSYLVYITMFDRIFLLNLFKQYIDKFLVSSYSWPCASSRIFSLFSSVHIWSISSCLIEFFFWIYLSNVSISFLYRHIGDHVLLYVFFFCLLFCSYWWYFIDNRKKSHVVLILSKWIWVNSIAIARIWNENVSSLKSIECVLKYFWTRVIVLTLLYKVVYDSFQHMNLKKWMKFSSLAK